MLLCGNINDNRKINVYTCMANAHLGQMFITWSMQRMGMYLFYICTNHCILIQVLCDINVVKIYEIYIEIMKINLFLPGKNHVSIWLGD